MKSANILRSLVVGAALLVAGAASAQAPAPAPAAPAAAPPPVVSTAAPPVSRLDGVNLPPAAPGSYQSPSMRPEAGLMSNDAELLRALAPTRGQVTIPDQKLATLIQPAGRDWRAAVKGPIRVWGSWLILGMCCLLIAFYLLRGKIMIDSGMSDLLLPLLGPDAFTSISVAFKYLHNYLAFGFMLGVVLMFVLWVRHNIPSKVDLQWIAVGGGLFTKGVHPPAEKFNAGQKIIFWSVITGGVALSVSGVWLMFPFFLGDVASMQLMQVIHAVVSLVLTAIVIAHIYIGSLGMEQAFDAMGTGLVDENWAKEHHGLWLAKLKGQAAPQYKMGHD